MKYIKTFEAWPDYIQFYSLKKYAIYKTVKNNYVPIKLIQSSDNFKITVNSLIFVEKDIHYNPQGCKKGREFDIDVNSLRDNIVFQSDDREEIRKELELLNTTNKFNL